MWVIAAPSDTDSTECQSGSVGNQRGVLSQSHIPAMLANVTNNFGHARLSLSVQPFVRGQIFVLAGCFGKKVFRRSFVTILLHVHSPANSSVNTC